MHLLHIGRLSLLAVTLFAATPRQVMAEQAATGLDRKVRVTGVVRDQSNNITLPGLAVEVSGGETVYTDVDGRYVVELAPGSYELRIAMDGYDSRALTLDVAAGSRVIDLDVGLTMARFTETVTVVAGGSVDAATSSAEARSPIARTPP